MKKQRKQVIAWYMSFVLCLLPVFSAAVLVQAQETADEHVLQGPVIAAEDGKVIWDCIHFGNYWQSKYIAQPGNRPEQGEDDVVHTDADGTKFLVREDKSCYRYEPIKWRVLSVSEDGTDAFLMADQEIDVQKYHSEKNVAVTWENSDIRTWLNDDFMNTAFTEEEQEAIIETEIENPKNPYAVEEMEEEADTLDKVYLPSLDEVTTRSYGFVEDLGGTETRLASATDFVNSGGSLGSDGFYASGYLLRTLGIKKDYVSHVTFFSSDGGIPTNNLYAKYLNDISDIRPVLHLDLTKADVWTYAGQVKQDQTETAPDATPTAPTSSPAVQPGVTMAPEQIYPKNPVINSADLEKNTWDCIYFGSYYNSRVTPSALSRTFDHDTIQIDENGNPYLVRHEEGYFYYEPIKWRVLSINEDGTDAFLMADQVLDGHSYFSEQNVEITWEKSDIRYWLANDFFDLAFTEEEKAMILETEVKTADNESSGEPGGNDTLDKIYLPSIEEISEPSYGFIDNTGDEATREVTVSDYAGAEEKLDWTHRDPSIYWLRSPGEKKGYPAIIASWGRMESADSTRWIGVRPVMHVDLSDLDMWSYAGQVTPKGVVAPETEQPTAPPEQTESPEVTEEPEQTKAPEATKQPDAVATPPVPTDNPQTTVEPEVKKPGKPVIKKLKNKPGKKVAITLYKKVPGAVGYQVAYATKSSMKGQKIKSFTGTSTTVKGLKKKKTYYFRVRAYVKENGKTVYGSWGNKKKIKIKK